MKFHRAATALSSSGQHGEQRQAGMEADADGPSTLTVFSTWRERMQVAAAALAIRPGIAFVACFRVPRPVRKSSAVLRDNLQQRTESAVAG